jgi:hypothetical protein
MCWLDDMCNDSHEGHYTNKVTEESTLIPTKNAFGLVFLGGQLWPVFHNIFSSALKELYT